MIEMSMLKSDFGGLDEYVYNVSFSECMAWLKWILILKYLKQFEADVFKFKERD